MEQRNQEALKKRYMAAVDSFISKVKDDSNVIAAIVSGSVSYDLVWEKSDIDMTLVVRDQLLKTEDYCIVEDGITINVYLMTRSTFKRGMEKNIGGSFSMSYFANGKIVYTTDDSLYDYFEELKTIGTDDVALTLFHLASELINIYDKSLKWLTVRKDPVYAQYFLLKAAEPIAHMEMCLHRKPISRDSIQKAMLLNPDMLAPFYTGAMSHFLSEQEILHCIEKLDGYLEQNLDMLKRPVLEFMADQEVKTMTMLSRHFQMNAHFIIDVFDYLVDKGVLEKVAQTIRITPKSKMAVEEIGYLYIP